MAKYKWTIGFVFILSAHFIFADKGLPASITAAQEIEEPWFTGPLLTPSGHIVPGGYYNIEPYTYVNVLTGAYDTHWHAMSSVNFYNVMWQIFFQIGLADWMDFQFVPSASWNGTQGVSSLVVNDPLLYVDFQLYQNSKKKYLPAIKLTIQETFPLGKYQRLDPEMQLTDLGGAGAYTTTFGLSFSTLFHLSGIHYISLRWNGYYALSTPVRVKGLNAYGGAYNTKGTVRPGNGFGYYIGMESTLSKNWVFALDIAGQFRNKSTFSGEKGISTAGLPASVGQHSSVSFSLAPAIEYNFSDSLGIIAGSQFTVAGRNSPQFASGVIAINYYGPAETTPARVRPYTDTGGSGR